MDSAVAKDTKLGFFIAKTRNANQSPPFESPRASDGRTLSPHRGVSGCVWHVVWSKEARGGVAAGCAAIVSHERVCMLFLRCRHNACNVGFGATIVRGRVLELVGCAAVAEYIRHAIVCQSPLY